MKKSMNKLYEWQDINRDLFDVLENPNGFNSISDLVRVGKRIIEFNPIEAPLGVFSLFSGARKFSNAVTKFAIFSLSPADEVSTAFVFAWGFYSIVNGIEKIFDWRQPT